MTRRDVRWLWLGLAGTVAVTNAQGAGFQLFEQGVSGLGTAFAGSAAAEDASTVFWNPAGMSFLKNHSNFISAGVQLLEPNAEFNNQGSTTASGAALRGGSGGDAGELSALPNLYYAYRFANGIAIGVGLSAQFGLKTEYDADWVGRYQAIKSELQTVTLNPSVSFPIGERVAIGVGLDILKADAELTSKLNFGAALPALGSGSIPAGALSQQADGKSEVSGDAVAYGFNLGAMFKLGDATKLGVSYRSKIKVKIDGDAKFEAPNVTSALLPVGPGGSLVTVPLPGAVTQGVAAAFNNTFRSQGAKAEVELPDFASIGFHTQIDDRWAVMGDISWTHWSSFKELRVKFDGGLPDSVTPENWDDTFKFAIGATFKPSEKWTLRAGLAYDQQAASDEFLTPRIPDAERTWVALGFNYQFTPHAGLDVGYTHVFVGGAKLNKTSEEADPRLRTTLRGDYDSSVDILGVQFNFRF